jgi:hypothetical protein
VFNVNYYFRSTTIKITDWLPLCHEGLVVVFVVFC